MPRNVINVEEITVAEAKELMEIAEGELSEFQRRAYDYATKFAKIDADTAKRLVKVLMERFSLSRKDAIQVANCVPSSIEELRTILTVKGKVITTEQLEKILSTINEIVKEKPKPQPQKMENE